MSDRVVLQILFTLHLPVGLSAATTVMLAAL